MAIDPISAISTTETNAVVPVYNPLAAYAASKAYAAAQAAAAPPAFAAALSTVAADASPLTAAPAAVSADQTRSFAPGPSIGDSAGSTVPQASDYNAQAALGLAFASPAVVTSLAPGAAALAAVASLPAVGPVEYLAPIARGSIIADPRFVDVYR